MRYRYPIDRLSYNYTADEAWRAIRSMRHEPPGYASLKPRRQLFASAMEQSEQLFRLSDDAGYETKPILLYYGLNQAARAIVAGAANKSEPWKVQGHGLRCPNLNEVTALGELTVTDHGRGGFQQLAKYVGSPTLRDKVEFRELWTSLPEGTEVPLPGVERLWSAGNLRLNDPGRSHLDSSNAGVFIGQFPISYTAQEFWPSMLAKFPGLAGFKPMKRDDGRLRVGLTLSGP